MNSLKKLVLAALALGISLSAAGCGGTVSVGGSYDPYYHAWYDVYGNYCYTGHPYAGCNYYTDGTYYYYYNNSYYSSGYTLSYGTYSYSDSYGYSQSYTGYGWYSPSGTFYGENGYPLNEQGQTEGRDLIADVAAKEKAKVTEAGKGLAATHALSEVSGIQIAETLNQWATLGKKHGRTEADIADFSKRLFGVSVAQVQPALIAAQQGDLSGLDTLNNDVATHWNTDPETSKEILMGWYRQEVAQAQSNHR